MKRVGLLLVTFFVIQNFAFSQQTSQFFCGQINQKAESQTKNLSSCSYFNRTYSNQQGTGCDEDCELQFNPACGKLRVPLNIRWFISPGANSTNINLADKVADFNEYFTEANIEFFIMDYSGPEVNNDFADFHYDDYDCEPGGINDNDFEEISLLGIANAVNLFLVEEVFACSECNGLTTPSGFASNPYPTPSDVALVVLDAADFASDPFGPKLAAHELGHILGLYHTFDSPQLGSGNENCFLDDGIEDTPCHINTGCQSNYLTNSNCQSTSFDNGQEVPPANPCNLSPTEQEILFRNIMNYNLFHDCFELEFTQCQQAKMQDVLSSCATFSWSLPSPTVSVTNNLYFLPTNTTATINLSCQSVLPSLFSTVNSQGSNSGSCIQWIIYEEDGNILYDVSNTNSLPLDLYPELREPGTYQIYAIDRILYNTTETSAPTIINLTVEPVEGVELVNCLSAPTTICVGESISFSTNIENVGCVDWTAPIQARIYDLNSPFSNFVTFNGEPVSNLPLSPDEIATFSFSGNVNLSPGNYKLVVFYEDEEGNKTTIFPTDDNCPTPVDVTVQNCTQPSLTATWPPAPGACFEPGDQVLLTWSSTGSIPLVKLEYCEVGGSCNLITTGTYNDGQYSWTVTGASGDGDYVIRLTDVYNPATSAEGEVFQILADCSPPVYGCTDPNAHNYAPSATVDDGSCETCSDNVQNGDETGVDCGGVKCAPCAGLASLTATWPPVTGNCYEVGSQQTLSWTSSGNIPVVHLEACKVLAGADDCEVIQLFVPNSEGSNSYNWTVSTPDGEGTYYFKVYDPANTSINDTGNSFEIANDCSGGTCDPVFVTLNAPEDNAVFLVGTEVHFSWQHNGPPIGPCAPQSYQMEFDDNNDFTSPTVVGPLTINAFDFTYNSPTVRHWRVRILNNNNEYGPWSASRRFTIQGPPTDGFPLELAASLNYPNPFCRLEEATVVASIHNPNEVTWTGELGAALLTPNNLDESQFIERKLNETLLPGQTKTFSFTGVVTISTASPILGISKKDNGSENTVFVEDGNGDNVIPVSLLACTGSEYVDGDLTVINEDIDEANSSLYPGGEIQVSCEQRWVGISSETLRPYVGYFISSDATWSGDDIYLGRDRSSLFGCSIDPCGVEEYEEATLDLPAYLIPGNYFLLFVADYNDAYEETNENNNVAAEANFTISPVEPSNCPSPTGLTYSNVTTSSATLEWNAVNEANAYEVEWTPAGGSTSLEYSLTTSIGLFNLDANTEHCFRVRTVCPDGTGAFSGQVCFTTDDVQTTCTIVTNTNDAGPGSFREAINCANTHAGPDLISFDIPGTGPHVIQLNSILPTLTDDATTIDATTQPGYYLGVIEVKSPSQNLGQGLLVSSDNAEIYGMQLTSFGTGIRVPSSNPITVTIGGVGKGNYFKSNLTSIFALANISGNDPTVIVKGNMIEGYGPGRGINVQSSGNTIGGALPGEGNSITNHNEGICNCSSIGTNNIVRGNSIFCTAIGISASNGAVPSITSATTSSISGTTTPNTIVDVYISDNTDCPSNNVCQGKIFLGHTTSNGSGAWSLSAPFNALVGVGDQVTATATRTGFSTSGFSSCVSVTGGTAPLTCTTLTSPMDGATEVDINASLSWNSIAGATGYYLSVGTSPGGTEVLNNLDVGNNTTYNPATFGYLTTIFVTITPYDASGTATGCQEESFTTESAPCLNRTVLIGATGDYTLQVADVFDLSAYSHISITSILPATVTCNEVGNTIPVTVNMENQYGVQGSCTAMITVADQIAPSIQCPDDQALELDAQCGGTVPDFIAQALVNDNCDPEPVVTQTPSAGTAIGEVGTTIVTLTATDFSANSTSCTVKVEKRDGTPPLAVCQDNTVYLDPYGQYELEGMEALDVSASADNCGEINFAGASLTSFDCADYGQALPVTLTVTDGAGNTATCTATVNVEQGDALPEPWLETSIGGAIGDATYAPCDGIGGTFSVSTNGYTLPNSDKTYPVYQKVCTNTTITAHIVDVDNNGWAGIMVRETLESGSKKIALKTQLNTFVRRDIRVSTNGFQQTQQLFRPYASWLQIVRNGSYFYGYTSTNGINWQPAFAAVIPMTACVYVGLFTESQNVNTTVTAQFDQVSITNGGAALAALPDPPDIAIQPDDISMELYPNPATSEVNVVVPNLKAPSCTLRLFNGLGQVVFQQEYRVEGGLYERLDLTGFQRGVYWVELGLDDNSYRSKLIID